MLDEINSSRRRARNPMIAPAALVTCGIANGGLCECSTAMEAKKWDGKGGLRGYVSKGIACAEIWPVKSVVVLLHG